jgi:hypothetical protein
MKKDYDWKTGLPKEPVTHEEYMRKKIKAIKNIALLFFILWFIVNVLAQYEKYDYVFLGY